MMKKWFLYVFATCSVAKPNNGILSKKMSMGLRETISKSMIMSKCHYKFEREFELKYELVCEYERA